MFWYILDISTVSLSESILIKSNFTYLYELQCDNKINEYVIQGHDYEIASETVWKEHGCKTISETPLGVDDNLEYYTCPCNFKHPLMTQFLMLHDAYEKGILPEVGGVLDQSNYCMEVLSIIQYLKDDYKITQQKEQAKNNK